jgi:hypothetical protein
MFTALARASVNIISIAQVCVCAPRIVLFVLLSMMLRLMMMLMMF